MGSTRDDCPKLIEIGALNQHAISAALFANDGKHIVGGGAEGMLRWWRASDGKEDGKAIQVGAKISTITLSPDGKWLVLCGLHGSNSKSIVQMWNAETHQKVRDIKRHANTVTSVDVSPDSVTIVTGSNDKYARVWRVTDGKEVTSLRHDKPVVAVRFSPSGDRLATATEHTIRIFDTKKRKQLSDISCPFHPNLSSPLSWLADDHHMHIYAASYNEVKYFNTSSGSFKLVAKWSVPGGSPPASIAVSRNKKFIIIAAGRSLSFRDTATHERIGSAIEVTANISCLALSNDCVSIATGEQNGKIIIWNLRGVLPDSYFPPGGAKPQLATPAVPLPPSRFPLIRVTDSILNLWTSGQLTQVESLLTEQTLQPSDPSTASLTLAHRALVRCRLKQYDKALDDAEKSIQGQRYDIGYVSLAIARVGNGEYNKAMSVLDVAIADRVSTESHLLVLIKAIIMFEFRHHEGAIERVEYLISLTHDKSPYVAVRAHMFFSLGDVALHNSDVEKAAEFLGRAQEVIPFQNGPFLTMILLVFGWDFDTLALAIQGRVQECIWLLEDLGDADLKANNPRMAIEHYSRALSLHSGSSNPATHFVKLSEALGMLESWDEALQEADKAIKADSLNPHAYVRKQAALHALKRFDEAVDVYTRMFSLIGDQDLRREYRRSFKDSIMTAFAKLVVRYIRPAQSEAAIIGAVREVTKICPIILIDVETGYLCDTQKRIEVFKSESPCKELISSMTLELDNTRIHQVVTKFFEFVTFSHVWEGEEPSFQVVQSVGSIWKLDEQSPLNSKLRLFCQVVRTDGYRWAWSDTCCIDKTISTVLNESLTMMYRWYEASAATYAYLFDVDLESNPGHGLKDCKWMTRAWTNQELLAPKVIRFYDRNWKPYLGDTHSNHKESPKIMQELADAVHIPLETIRAFHPDNLSVREKLRIASTRNATREEDVAYSLIGIFGSDILPHYGEGASALGHLLEEIVTRSSDVTVLAWTGKSSSYNSCLPATLAVYNQLPPTPSLDDDDAEMIRRVAALQTSVSDADVIRAYKRITRLPLARFAHRRLYLPCITFAVQSITMQDFVNDLEHHYCASVKGIGDVEFHTSDRLPVKKPHKFLFVYPWIHDLRGPTDGFTWADTYAPGEDESESEPEETAGPLNPEGEAIKDEAIRAFSTRVLIHLQQPFRPLLLERQSHGEFKRVATENEITVQKLDPTPFLKHFSTKIVEIL